MAITTVDAVIAYVMFVTKLDWLLSLYPLPRVPGRAIDFGADPERGEQNKDSAENAELGEGVGTVMEDLWHRRRFANPICDYCDQRAAGRAKEQSRTLIDLNRETAMNQIKAQPGPREP